MKKSRFSESQIVSILKEVEDGANTNDVCRLHGISNATYYNWKSKFGGMQASELRKLRETESELSRLKRMYVDLALENHTLKELVEKKL